MQTPPSRNGVEVSRASLEDLLTRTNGPDSLWAVLDLLCHDAAGEVDAGATETWRLWVLCAVRHYHESMLAGIVSGVVSETADTPVRVMLFRHYLPWAGMPLFGDMPHDPAWADVSYGERDSWLLGDARLRRVAAAIEDLLLSRFSFRLWNLRRDFRRWRTDEISPADSLCLLTALGVCEEGDAPPRGWRRLAGALLQYVVSGLPPQITQAHLAGLLTEWLRCETKVLDEDRSERLAEPVCSRLGQRSATLGQHLILGRQVNLRWGWLVWLLPADQGQLAALEGEGWVDSPRQPSRWLGRLAAAMLPLQVNYRILIGVVSTAGPLTSDLLGEGILGQMHVH